MRIVVTGSSGQLGAYLIRELMRGPRHEVIAWSRGEPRSGSPIDCRAVDLTDPVGLGSALAEAAPDLILHAAAMSSADAVRKDPTQGWAVNVEGTRRLADWCRTHDRRLVFTSTDLVFDGLRGMYKEQDVPNPILAYGKTKAAAEAIVLEVPRGLVARISLLYGRSLIGRDSFYDRAVAELNAGKPQRFFEDEFRTPLHYAAAARALVQLGLGVASGIVHVGGRERVSRFELMRRVAGVLGYSRDLITANRQADVNMPEPRPADVSLDTSLLESLLPDLKRPSIEDSLLQETLSAPFY
jgi:dTDP-4-dehydrorhamnose reductase